MNNEVQLGGALTRVSIKSCRAWQGLSNARSVHTIRFARFLCRISALCTDMIRMIEAWWKRDLSATLCLIQLAQLGIRRMGSDVLGVTEYWIRTYHPRAHIQQSWFTDEIIQSRAHGTIIILEHGPDILDFSSRTFFGISHKPAERLQVERIIYRPVITFPMGVGGVGQCSNNNLPRSLKFKHFWSDLARAKAF